MKKLLLICLVSALSIGVCTASEKKKSKKTIATVVLASDIDCGSCVKKIMDNVHVLGKGIKDIKIDFPASQDITVLYDTRKNDTNQILEGLNKLDIKATSKVVKAKKLGDCSVGGCSDGGCSTK